MNEFDAKWCEIASLGHGAGYFRVYPDHLLNFLIDFSSVGRREVIVEATAENLRLPQLPTFKNVDLVPSMFAGGARLVLTLLDEELARSFSIMCYDLVERSKEAASVSASLAILLSALGNWADLLRRRSGKGLSENEALGLIGELLVVEALLDEQRFDTDAVIRGWRGPHGDTRDIGFDGARVEVKTLRSTGPVRLSISSLDQLDDRGDQVYVVLNRMSPSSSGRSLIDLVGAIRQRLSAFPNALCEFERKVELSGMQPEAVASQEKHGLDERLVYAVSEGFPRLVHGNVPIGVTAVKYELGGPILDRFRSNWSDSIGRIRT